LAINPIYDEKALLSSIAAGDEKAFRIFFDLYKERFYSVVLKMTHSDFAAEEIVQEVFVGIWKNRSALTNIDNPSTYFFTAVYRKVYSYSKKLALDRKLMQVMAEADQFKNITDETILGRERERLINEAIVKLPPQMQLVFRLSKQEGLSREQIAEKLKISPHTVRNHLLDAMNSIRSSLGNTALSAFYLFSLFKD